MALRSSGTDAQLFRNMQAVAAFELSACVIGVIVSFYLRRKNRALNSPLITTEMQGWEIDSVISLGMALAFLIPAFVPFDWFQPVIPYVDQMITIALSLCMIPVPIKTVITGLRDLMLIPPEEDTITEIKDTVEPIIRSYNCSKLYYDIVRTGRKLWISVYITMEKDEVSISRFKLVQTQCIDALAEKYADFYFELLPDIEFEEG